MIFSLLSHNSHCKLCTVINDSTDGSCERDGGRQADREAGREGVREGGTD